MRITISSDYMLATVMLFLPCMTCLFWLALNPLVHNKDKTFKALELLLAVTGIALFSEAGLTCTSGNLMLALFLAKQFSALLIIPAAYRYTILLSSSGKNGFSLQGYLVIPASLLAAQIILLLLTGSYSFMEIILYPAAEHTDKATKLISICSIWIFYVILAIEIVLFIVYALIKAIKANHQLELINTSATVIIYAVLELSVIYAFPLWVNATLSVILACIIFMLSYSGVFHKENNTKPAVNADQDPVLIPEKTAIVHQSQAETRPEESQ